MGRPSTWRGLFGTRLWPSSQATWPASPVEQPPPTQASPSCVDVCQPKLRLNHLKPWPTGQGVGSACRPLGPLGLGSSPLDPHVKYTPMVMMILTFGQLNFVIPWNAPIWYLSSWNQINTKIMELGYTRWIHGYSINLLNMLVHEINILWVPIGVTGGGWLGAE
jgi:hypothetical protein